MFAERRNKVVFAWQVLMQTILSFQGQFSGFVVAEPCISMNSKSALLIRQLMGLGVFFGLSITSWETWRLQNSAAHKWTCHCVKNNGHCLIRVQYVIMLQVTYLKLCMLEPCWDHPNRITEWFSCCHSDTFFRSVHLSVQVCHNQIDCSSSWGKW